jgi:hypothetical protein
MLLPVTELPVWAPAALAAATWALAFSRILPPGPLGGAGLLFTPTGVSTRGCCFTVCSGLPLTPPECTAISVIAAS